MRNRFDQQLHHLDEQLTHMGELCEIAISKVTQALKEGSAGQARIVVAEDEEIDQMEKEIERLCLKLLLQQQPVAKDLRRISAALKMITDMERIGDHATDISEITIQLADQQYIKELERTQEMAKEATVMLVKSIEAFVNKDIVLAGEVIGRDDRVDELFAEIKDELIDLIHQDTNNGAQAADFLMIAKYLERIGDHATNIAEWVIFSITGQHKSYETEKNGQKA